MIAVIALWLRTHPRHALAIGGLLAVVLVLGGVYLKGRHDNAKAEEAHRKVAEAAAIKLDAKADLKSTEALARDALVTAAKQKELEDAVANVPDTVPDAVAVAAGCVELRQHGISTADLPACRPAGR